jgi:hypothetical protein
MLRMRVYLHSCFIENHPIRILEDGPLISEVVLSQVHKAIYLQFVLQDPLVGNHIDPKRPRDHVSCVVGHQGLVLLLHSVMLVGIGEHATNRGRD